MIEYPLESFVFYRSFRDAIEEMSDADKLSTLLAICDYALYGIEPNLNGILQLYSQLLDQVLTQTRIGARTEGREVDQAKKPMVLKAKTNGFQKRKALKLKLNLKL